MTSINIDAPPLEAIHVTLVGKEYDIMPPKAAMAMRLAVEAKLFQDDPSKMAEAINRWIAQAFGKEEKSVQKRLADEKDRLDIPQITQLMEAVMEHQTGNPTS